LQKEKRFDELLVLGELADKPEIIKEQRERERLRKLQSKVKKFYEEFEVLDEQSKNVSDKTIASAEKDVDRKKERESLTYGENKKALQKNTLIKKYKMPKRFFGIQRKLLLVLIISIVGITTLSLVIGGYYTSTALRNQITDQLISISEARASYIEKFLLGECEKTEMMADNYHIEMFLKMYGEEPNSNDSHRYNVALSEINDFIRDEFYEISILDTGGIIVLSTNEKIVGESRADYGYFLEGKENVSVNDGYYFEPTKKEFLLISAPVSTDSNEDLLGVVIVEADMSAIFEIAGEWVGLGETGEILVARRDENGDATFFTNRRFEIAEDKIDVSIPHEMLKNEDMYYDAVDYRGESVIASTQYITSIDWGLVAKIDRSEAFAPIDNTNRIMIFIFTFISIIAIVVSYLTSKSITTPIIKLRNAAIDIGQGKMDTKIDVKTMDEIGNLAESFEDMRIKINDRTAEIEKLLKQKDEFVNQLGHDIKNPLGPLINLIPILEKRIDSPEYKEIFEILNRNTNHMKNLVTKTIQLAQLNSPSVTFSFEDTNLLSEIDDVIERGKLLFKEKNVEIENKISEDIVVKADKLKLTELFDNLINNAMKYCPNGGTITIDTKQDKDFVTISIKDTGMGITEEQLSHIFDEFYKADLARHDFDSSGLGLSICKRIVEKHGGKIWAESEGEGKGTTMLFTLPVSSKKADDGKTDWIVER